MRGGWVASVPAYNLLVWMMWLNNKDRFNEEPDTIRMCLINVPARLITRSRQWIALLSKNYVYRERRQRLEKIHHAIKFCLTGPQIRIKHKKGSQWACASGQHFRWFIDAVGS